MNTKREKKCDFIGIYELIRADQKSKVFRQMKPGWKGAADFSAERLSLQAMANFSSAKSNGWNR
jgi:hypothetical protein